MGLASPHRLQTALAGGVRLGEHMPATAGDSCQPSRELAGPSLGAREPRPVGVYAWKLETCSLPKAPGRQRWHQGVNYLRVHSAWEPRRGPRPGRALSSFGERWAPWCPTETEGGRLGGRAPQRGGALVGDQVGSGRRAGGGRVERQERRVLGHGAGLSNSGRAKLASLLAASSSLFTIPGARASPGRPPQPRAYAPPLKPREP